MMNSDVLQAKPFPKIYINEKKMTILVAQDDDSYCAFCPELDLVTELNSEDEALADLLEAMKEYAQEYLTDRTLYRNSPNRAHHYPYIKAIATCKNTWELKSLIEFRYGNLYV